MQKRSSKSREEDESRGARETLPTAFPVSSFPCPPLFKPTQQRNRGAREKPEGTTPAALHVWLSPSSNPSVSFQVDSLTFSVL